MCGKVVFFPFRYKESSTCYGIDILNPSYISHHVLCGDYLLLSLLVLKIVHIQPIGINISFTWKRYLFFSCHILRTGKVTLLAERQTQIQIFICSSM